MYYKPSNQPQLILRRRSETDDHTLLARAWQAANDKARELGWIVCIVVSFEYDEDLEWAQVPPHTIMVGATASIYDNLSKMRLSGVRGHLLSRLIAAFWTGYRRLKL